MKTHGRRTILKVVAGALALSPLVALQTASAQDDKIRLGLITQMSGFAQAYGLAAKAGAEIAVETINAAGGVNGKMLELVVRDDAAKTDTTVSHYRDLVGSGIKLIISGPISGPSVALTPLVEQDGVVMISAGATNLSMTHELYTPQAFRLSFTTVPYHGGLVQEVAKRNEPIADWAVISSDSQTVRDITKVMTTGLTKNYKSLYSKDITFHEEIVVKGGAGDFRNQLTQLANTNASGLVVGLIGSDAITFYKQARAFGLDDKFKVVVDLGGELQMAQALGEGLPKNIWSPTPWYAGAYADNAIAQTLNEKSMAVLNTKYPFGYVQYSYDAVVAFAEGIKAAGTDDPKALAAAIRDGSPMGAGGPIVFRKEDNSYLGELTYLNFGSDAGSEGGWKMIETVKIPSNDLIEPATPGAKYEIQ